MTIEALIPRADFVGLDGVTHLCAGGETPMLNTHREAFERFMADKAQGEEARRLEADRVEGLRAKCARLWSVEAADITFLSSASEGINNVAFGLDWREGDNVVVADVEFPSGILPWTRLQRQGVEVRIVRHRDWSIPLDDVAALIDERTRVVEVSQVSMLTGERLDLRALSALVRGSNALLLLDATHAAGVVPVEASLADVVVSSCYKWLLGVHGAALFYVNRDTLPEFAPPFLGWNSPVRHGGWQRPTEFDLQPSAHRFQPGNAAFLALYILDNALDRLLGLGIEAIERHALALGGRVYEAVSSLGFEMMTPAEPGRRAGNVCFLADNLEGLRAELERRQVLIWGAYAGFGRLRVSTHVYNDSADVERFADALREACR